MSLVLSTVACAAGGGGGGGFCDGGIGGGEERRRDKLTLANRAGEDADGHGGEIFCDRHSL